MFQYDENEFIKRLSFLVNTYYQSEYELLRVFEYIPASNRWDTFSYKLLFLLSTVVPSIEEGLRVLMFNPYTDANMLADYEKEVNKKRAENKKIDFSNLNSLSYLNLKETLAFHNKISNNRLSIEDIVFNYSFMNQKIVPFAIRNYAPAWYEDIGKIKHDLFKGLKLANIDNSISALAALYLICAIGRRELDVKSGKNHWYNSRKHYVTIIGPGDQLIIRSKLFPTLVYGD